MPNLQKNACRNIHAAFILIFILIHVGFSQASRDNFSIVLKDQRLFKLIEARNTNIASDNQENIYISLSNGTMVSINAKKSEKLWATDLGGDLVSTPLIVDESIYIVGKYTNRRNSQAAISQGKITDQDNIKGDVSFLRALDKSTGITKWQNEFECAALVPIEKSFLYSFGDYIIFVGNHGNVCALTKSDGRIVWEKNLGSELSSLPFIVSSEIFIGIQSNQIVSLSLDNGRTKERLEVSASPTAIINSKNGNNLIIGDKKGKLFFLKSSKDGKKRTQLWSFQCGAEVSSIIVTSKGLVISSFDNFVYLLSERNGDLIWKRRLGGRVVVKPQVKDGYLIITPTEAVSASVIKLENGRTVDKITLEDGDFFTGETLKVGDIFVYTTLRGIFSFSFADKMPSE